MPALVKHYPKCSLRLGWSIQGLTKTKELKIKIDSADTKWSKLAREKTPYCQNCGKKAIDGWVLNAHHIRPRGRSMTRFDPTNALVLCAYCHTLGDKSVHRSANQEAWVVRIIGQKEWNRLEKLSMQYKSREKARKEFLSKYT